MKSYFQEFEKNKIIIKKYLIVIGILIVVSFLLICFQQKEINKLKQMQEIQMQEQKKQVQLQEQQKFQKLLQDKEQDNISLRKTIQSISSRGTKPLNYTIPPRQALSFVTKGEYLGEWIITWYTPSKEECGNNKGITASGEPVIPGYSIAIDKRYWNFGTKLYIDGWGLVETKDTGNAIIGSNKADIVVFNKELANKFGVQKRKVWLVEN